MARHTAWNNLACSIAREECQNRAIIDPLKRQMRIVPFVCVHASRERYSHVLEKSRDYRAWLIGKYRTKLYCRRGHNGNGSVNKRRHCTRQSTRAFSKLLAAYLHRPIAPEWLAIIDTVVGPWIEQRGENCRFNTRARAWSFILRCSSGLFITEPRTCSMLRQARSLATLRVNIITPDYYAFAIL